jgi:hypothetical protein
VVAIIRLTKNPVQPMENNARVVTNGITLQLYALLQEEVRLIHKTETQHNHHKRMATAETGNRIIAATLVGTNE